MKQPSLTRELPFGCLFLRAEKPHGTGCTLSGGPAAFNEAGQSALKNILYGRDTAVFPMTGGRFEGGFRFVLPDGLGAVFSANGTIQYFGRFAQ